MTTKTTSVTVLLIGLFLSGASVASAQTDLETKIFVHVNVGGQPASQTLDATISVPVYGQTATAATTQSIGGKAIFDIMGGYRLRPSIGVAVGFSSFSNSATIAGTASVPSPLFFNQFKTVDISGAGVSRSDRNVYVLFVWFRPITDKIEIALFAGPTFTRVKQDLITNLAVPAGTQDAIPIVESQSGTAKGANVGFDGTYLFSAHYGAGIFLRYNGGSVDLPAATGVRAGGFQMGIGLRARF